MLYYIDNQFLDTRVLNSYSDTYTMEYRLLLANDATSPILVVVNRNIISKSYQFLSSFLLKFDFIKLTN